MKRLPLLRTSVAVVFALAWTSGSTLAQSILWIQQPGSVPGGASTNVRMAYDGLRGVSVLFGGNAPENHGINDQTWEWDGSVWARRLVAGPPARQNHAMVYDSVRHLVVLFGGNGDTGDTYLRGDTWEWDGAGWTQRMVTGPSPRFWHAMAYDSARGVTVLFGGWTGAYNGETWEWDGMVWTQRVVSGPAPLYQHAMAFDEVRGVTVLYGGYGPGPSRDSETWEWNGTSWTQRLVAGPGGLTQHTMVYNPVRQTTVLFGSNSNATMAQTWEWNGAAWSNLAITGPSWRYGNAMSMDLARNVTVVFGGSDHTGNAYGDTWELGCIGLSAQPVSQVVCAPGPASLTVSTTATGPFTYQWRRGAPRAPIHGATGPALTIDAVTGTDSGTYDCVVANACGRSTSGPLRLYVSSADFNGDGDTGTDADIESFFACLGGACCEACGSADFNGDGDLGTDADIESFFRVLAGGPC